MRPNIDATWAKCVVKAILLIRVLVGWVFLSEGTQKFLFPDSLVQRTATSIALLTVLVAGILAPTGVCALMCERHSRTESQRHCSEPADAMPGMVHDHSAMNHRRVEAMNQMLVSQSCRSN